MSTHNLLSKTIVSSDNGTIVIVNIYVVGDAVGSPESDDAGAVQQTFVHDVRQHSLGIIEQLLGFRTYNTCDKLKTADLTNKLTTLKKTNG